MKTIITEESMSESKADAREKWHEYVVAEKAHKNPVMAGRM